jgi:hypothetical protein
MTQSLDGYVAGVDGELEPSLHSACEELGPAFIELGRIRSSFAARR